jgi:AsmA-like C-terminal region/AsmA family
MASRKRRIPIFIAASCGVVVLALILALNLLPSETVRDLVIAQLEKETGRSISVAHVSGRLFPSPQISLDNLEIGDTGNSETEYLLVKSLILKLRFQPLLKRRIEVSSLVFDQPVFEFTLPAQGLPTDSAQDETGKPELVLRPDPSDTDTPEADESAAPNAPAQQTKIATAQVQSSQPPEEQISPPLNIEIEELLIQHGIVRIYQSTGEQMLIVGDINERLTAQLTSTGDLLLSGRTDLADIAYHTPSGILGRDLTCRLEKSLSFDRKADRLSLTEVRLQVGDLPIELSGYIEAVSAPAPVCNIELSGGPAEMNSILAILPTELFPEVAGIESGGTIELSGSLTGSPGDLEGKLPEFDFQLNLNNGHLTHPKLPERIDRIDFDLAARPESIYLHNVRIESGENLLEMEVKLFDYLDAPRMVTNLAATVALATLPDWPQFPDSIRLAGQVETELAISSDARYSDQINLTGSASIHEGGYRFIDQPFEVKEFTGQIDVDLTVSPPTEALSQTKQIGQLSPLEQLTTAVKILDGQMTLQAQAMTLNEAPIENLNGVVTIEGHHVSFRNIEMQAFGGEVELAGSMAFAESKPPQFKIDSGVTNVKASQLYGYAQGLNNFGKLGDFLTGDINCKASMSGRLDSELGVSLTSLSSQGRMETSSATLENHPLQQLLAKFFSAPEINRLSVSSWLQPFMIQNGKLNLDGMHFKADQVDIEGKGWQALDGSLNLSLNVILPRAMSGNVTKQLPGDLSALLFGSANSRIQLPVVITGNITSPVITLNSAQLQSEVQQRVEQQLQSERDQLEDNLLNEAEKLLEGLISDDGDSTSTKQQTLEKNVKGLFKNLFKKK